MIAQVQSDDAVAEAPAAAGPAAPAAAPRAPAAPQASGAAPLVASEAPRTGLRRTDGIEESGGEAALHQDPLRRRMAELDARAALERSERDRKRRRMYEDEEPSGSGAFLVGFVLTVLVGVALLAAYTMRGPIVERYPQSEQMLTEYGNRVDDLRAGIVDGYERGRSWVVDKIGEPG